MYLFDNLTHGALEPLKSVLQAQSDKRPRFEKPNPHPGKRVTGSINDSA